MDIEQQALRFYKNLCLTPHFPRFRKAGYQAVDRICEYYYTLQNRSVIPKVEPGYLKNYIPRKPPASGSLYSTHA
jgi:hypothetical protein